MDDQLRELFYSILRWEIRRFQIASIALIGIGAGCFALTVYAIKSNTKLEWQTLVLIGATAVCFGLPLIRKIDLKKDGGGFVTGTPIEEIKIMLTEQRAAAEAARTESFKQTQQQLAGLTNEVEEATELRRNLAAPAETKDAPDATLREIRNLLPPAENKEDQQKGRFGGKEEANGRKLSATTKPSAINKDWRVVTLKVESTDGKSLQGKYVYLFLHQTFKPDAYKVAVDKSGMEATFEISAYGGFTVGAIADQGNTRLELDMITSPNIFAPTSWRVA